MPGMSRCGAVPRESGAYTEAKGGGALRASGTPAGGGGTAAPAEFRQPGCRNVRPRAGYTNRIGPTLSHAPFAGQASFSCGSWAGRRSPCADHAETQCSILMSHRGFSTLAV